MTQLSSYLSLEVAKYKDIDHILKKLDEDGETQNLFNAFKDIFENERSFTMQQLSRIEDEKKEKINLHEQCENNLSMFKNSFSLIVQMIVDKAYKFTALENKSRISQNTDTTRAESTMEPPSVNTIPAEESPTKKKTKRSDKSRRGVSPTSTAISLNRSVERTATPKKIKKKKSINLGTSITSPLTRILSPGSTMASREGLALTSTISRDKSTMQLSQNYGPNSNRMSRSNIHQSPGVLSKSQSFVQSEFNHIHGAVIFPKSPKTVENREFSPGPGAYQTNVSSLNRSPSASIDRAPKVCYFDEVAQRNESPGPGGLYPSHHFLSK